ncbi:MAG: class I mannose-6-phosphate isomerase [Erythrobacter sp.]
MVEKVWGCESLPAPFTAPSGQRIGEIWFEPPPELPSILAKYLFTSEKLSVQVHPSAAQAQTHEEGKEECWLVLDAEPDARLAIGFKEPIDGAEMRAAALDGSIEQLLEWHPVQAGDFFHLTPGTVHAIGPGISLVEIQQNSDTTFRLFDYGRPRELHLDRAIEVAEGVPYPPERRGKIAAGSSCLLDGEYFRFDRIVGSPSPAERDAFTGPLLVMPLAGSVGVAGQELASGACAYVPSMDVLDFGEAEITLLVRPN